MERVSVPKPETREVCTACGQVDGYHLQKCRISELQAEVERLRGEVVNRNQRALDGDKATAAFNAEYERAEQHRIRAESAERKLAEYTDERGIVRCRNIATCLDTENKLAEAVAALRKYGKHSQLCSVVGGYVGSCTCGFDEVTK
jgi:hypothetical protein